MKNNFEANKIQYAKEYVHLHIFLKQQMYLWGQGWVVTNEVVDKFNNTVKELIDLLGFKTLPSKEKVVTNASDEGVLDMENMYFHPMEFTGYIKKENVDKVIKIIKDFDTELFSVSDVKQFGLKLDRPSMSSVYSLENNLNKYNRIMGN